LTYSFRRTVFATMKLLTFFGAQTYKTCKISKRFRSQMHFIKFLLFKTSTNCGISNFLCTPPRDLNQQAETLDVGEACSGRRDVAQRKGWRSQVQKRSASVAGAFFLSWVANTQPNHWTEWVTVVNTQLGPKKLFQTVARLPIMADPRWLKTVSMFAGWHVSSG